jgi:hypothetical protein
MSRRTATLGAVAAVPVLAVLMRLVYGPGTAGYDAAYSLVWGRDLVHLRTPDFSAIGSPTEHPLANLVGGLLSPLGADAVTALVALSFLSFAALAVAAYLLGRRLYSIEIGLLFALIVVTRDSLVNETLQSVVDIPFLALVVGAAALEAARPRRGLPVVALLAVGGLLRPEAWLLSVAYLAYLFPVFERGRWLRLAGLATAAPLAWAGLDMAVTGDALHSLHGTRELAEELGRPRSTDTALRAAPVYLRFLLHPAVAIIGVAGALAGLWALYSRSLLPAAITALSLAAFLVLGVAGLPLLTRYLLPAAVMLCLFCAVVVFGWRLLDRGGTRSVWMLAGAIAAVVLVASAPADVRRTRHVRSFIETRHEAQAGLGEFARRRDVARLLAGCRVTTSSRRAVPDLAFALDRPLTDFAVGPVRVARFVAPANAQIAATYALEPGSVAPGLPRAMTEAARSRAWVLGVDRSRRCASASA